MSQITITFDFTPEALEALKPFAASLSALSNGVSLQSEHSAADTQENEKEDVPKKEVKKTTAKDKKEADKKEADKKEEKTEKPETAELAVTLTDVRSIALKLSKAGKQKLLKEIFAKYGAEKLSEIAEEDYANLKNDLEEANE